MDKWLRTYSRGEYIVLQGQTAHTFGVLHTGSVGVYRDDQQIATIHESGAFIGEMAWLLTEQRTASVKAETNGVSVFLIPSQGFEPAMKARPELGLRLAQTLARRLKRVTRELSAERVAVPGEARLNGMDPATARLINTIRTACELRMDDDLLRVLLLHALRMTGPINPNIEPPHEAVRDLADAALDDKKTVDVKAILEKVKAHVFTPQSRPNQAASLNPSIAPGSAQGRAVHELRPKEDLPPPDAPDAPAGAAGAAADGGAAGDGDPPAG